MIEFAWCVLVVLLAVVAIGVCTTAYCWGYDAALREFNDDYSKGYRAGLSESKVSNEPQSQESVT